MLTSHELVRKAYDLWSANQDNFGATTTAGAASLTAASHGSKPRKSSAAGEVVEPTKATLSVGWTSSFSTTLRPTGSRQPTPTATNLCAHGRQAQGAPAMTWKSRPTRWPSALSRSPGGTDRLLRRSGGEVAWPTSSSPTRRSKSSRAAGATSGAMPGAKRMPASRATFFPDWPAGRSLTRKKATFPSARVPRPFRAASPYCPACGTW